jgi:hypothetical protein
LFVALFSSVLGTIASADDGSEELGPMPRGQAASQAWRDKAWAIVADVREQLVKHDDASHRAAQVERLKMLLRARPAFVTKNGDGVIRDVYGLKLYAEVIDLADYGIAQHPESSAEIGWLQKYKTLSLLALGRKDEGLRAARAYYNVGRYDRSTDAAQVVAGALRQAGGADAERLAADFLAAHARSHPVAAEDLYTPLPQNPALQAITLDAEAYAEQIRTMLVIDDSGLIGRANLLLLDGRVDEAVVAFSEVYGNGDAKYVAAAAEGIARAMRATDGHLSRAEAWLATPWPAGPKDDPRVAPARVASAKTAPVASPSDVAKSLKLAQPAVDWLAAWEGRARAAEPGKADAAAEDVTAFATLLASENATPEQWTTLLRSVLAIEDKATDKHHSPYPPVSGAIACRAVMAGTTLARADAKRKELAMNAVAPLIERLWYGPERATLAAQTFYQTLAATSPHGSPDWLRGHAANVELLLQLRRFDEALAANATVLNDASLSIENRLYSRWLQGHTLSVMGRYAESVPHLKAFAEARHHERSSLALEILVETLGRLGDFEGAREAWREAIRRGRTSDERALELGLTLDLIEKGRAPRH